MGHFSYSYRPSKVYPSEGRVRQALSFDLHGLVKRGVISLEVARSYRRALREPGPSDTTGKTAAIAAIDRLIEHHPNTGRAERRPRARGRSRYDRRDRGYPARYSSGAW